ASPPAVTARSEPNVCAKALLVAALCDAASAGNEASAQSTAAVTGIAIGAAISRETAPTGSIAARPIAATPAQKSHTVPTSFTVTMPTARYDRMSAQPTSTV